MEQITSSQGFSKVHKELYEETRTPSHPTLGESISHSLRASFEERGHEPTENQWNALCDVIKCLDEMSQGKADKVTYFASLDPGLGKTQILVHYLKALTNSSLHANVGAVVFVSKLDEIKALLKEAELQANDIAILTSDSDLNHEGTCPPKEAQVLFTTQQMFYSRSAGRHFADIEEFFYLGQPRRVKIWDESLIPASPLILRRDHISELVPFFRKQCPALAEELDSFHASLREAESGATVRVPDVGNLPSKHQLALPIPTHLSEADRALRVLSGREVSVEHDGYLGKTLVDFEPSIPKDFSPVLVLDASIRVRTTYSIWSQTERTKVRHLAHARKDYGNLEVHWWDTASGKDIFKENENVLFSEIANTITGQLEETWLIVTYKDVETKLRSYIEAQLPPGVDCQVIHWGQHRATNDFINARNIILAGVLSYPRSYYVGLARASLKRSTAEGAVDNGTVQSIAFGELCHDLLQSVSRIGVRRLAPNNREQYRAYIIAPAKRGVRGALLTCFPGAKLVTWSPHIQELKGNMKKVADYLEERFAEPSVQEVSSKEARTSCGITRQSNFSYQIVRHPAFEQWLHSQGLEYVPGTFQRAPCMFSDDDD